MIMSAALSCAKMGFPPGGPDDNVAPVLISSYPASLATNIPTDSTIRLEFSERMDEQTVEDNLVIVPIPSRWPEYSWETGGTVLKLDFPDNLRDNSTYVISVGSKAADLRKNDLGETVNISFSTGDKLENGMIRGRVVPFTFLDGKPESNSGIDVAAFRINGDGVSPDPRRDVPDYVTQSGDDGTFEFIGLSSGNYRLFAIDDKDKNGFYSEGYDLFGVCSSDIALAADDSLAFSPDIAVAAFDTSLVQLLSATAKDVRRVEFFFDRVVDASSAKIVIEGLETGELFSPVGKETALSVTTSAMEDGRKYTVDSVDVRDRYGNRIMPMSMKPYFPGTADPDTTALAVEKVDKTILAPGDGAVTAYFNRALDADLDGPVLEGTPPCEIRITKTAVNALSLEAEGAWPAGSVFSLRFDPDRVRGIGGARLAAEGPHLEFTVVSQDTLAYIAGSLEDSAGQGDGKYLLEFRNTESESGFALHLEETGDWETGAVLPGRYLLRAVRDENGNGKLDAGHLIPFTRPEQVVTVQDTLVVVSRWTNGDNTIVFR